MKDISSIIKGHVKEVLKQNEELSTYRLNICKGCPLCYDSAWGLLCNRFKWIDKTTGVVSDTSIDGYIRGCGCRLDAKTRNNDDECVIGKW